MSLLFAGIFCKWKHVFSQLISFSCRKMAFHLDFADKQQQTLRLVRTQVANNKHVGLFNNLTAASTKSSKRFNGTTKRVRLK
jgi:hypothetical protein